MVSPFDDRTIFQHATFTFKIANGVKQLETNKRGFPVVNTTEVKVRFKLSPGGDRTMQEVRKGAGVMYEETYSARVLSGNLKLPKGIYPEDTGEGEINGKKCTATVKGIAQSGVYPVVGAVLGDKVTIAVKYHSNNAAT